MGKMSAQFRERLKTRKIVKIEVDKEMIKKEIEQAEYDLEKATNSLRAGGLRGTAVKVSVVYSVSKPTCLTKSRAVSTSGASKMMTPSYRPKVKYTSRIVTPLGALSF